jgi:hypothetical protein
MPDDLRFTRKEPRQALRQIRDADFCLVVADVVGLAVFALQKHRKEPDRRVS